jgi:cobalt transporter subunit CbtB
MQSSDVKRPSLVRANAVGVVLPVLLAALLGLFVVWGAGFAGAEMVHNAAHDARHANGFPCH